jgi:flagellar basal body-associated protein FliL
MPRILAALPLVLLSLAAYAVEAEPPVESNMVGTIIFIVLFVGGCAAFAWMIWKNEKKSKQKAGQQ